MFFNDHEPPHFHVSYGEFEALIDVNTFEVYRGELPRRALALTLEWAALHRDELQQDWQLAKAGQLPRPIAPLE
jgi:hypothetical protein